MAMDESTRQKFRCTAGIAGKLLCVNKRLETEPELLWRRPHDAGYLAVMALHKREHAAAVEGLHGAEEYGSLRGVPMELVRHCGVFDHEQYANACASVGVTWPLTTVLATDDPSAACWMCIRARRHVHAVR
jgi:hypothetical protein